MRHLINLVESAQDGWAYHGTILSNLESISKFGLQSNFRPKWSPDWEDGSKRQRSYHLLYFSLEGPDGWGSNHDPRGEDTNIELRFPLAALGKKPWQEDDERPGRDEHYAVGSREFGIPPQAIQVQYEGRWMPLPDFMQNEYWEL